MTELLERRPIFRALLLLAMVGLTILVYASALHGPFLLDDLSNLDTIQRWFAGRADWRTAIDNRSGPLGRPVAMLTFLADAARTGSVDSFAFKPTNLAIHILCGLLAYVLARQIFRRVPTTTRHATLAALFVAAVWLWLPLQVSTVLYVVQRMAQLSALFVFAALIVFMYARQRLERSPDWQAHALLWLAVPVIAGIGALSKESAVLALPLALVFEWTLFTPLGNTPRPRSVRLFFVLTVVLPGIACVAWLLLHPMALQRGYALRDFTFTERLLTEPRILWSYVRTLVFPVGPDMGLFHDNYPVSRSWTTPATTLPAIAAWCVTAIVAVQSRHRAPLVTLGIGFFLVGHALESTVVPLELYFEHRNYLPSFGVVIALVGIGIALAGRLRQPTAEFRRLSVVFAVAVPLLYAAGTWVQAGAWSQGETLFAMQESYNPTSPRLQSTLAARAIEVHDIPAALRHIDLSERYSPASERMTTALWRMIAYCEGGLSVPPSVYDEFDASTSLRISNFAMNYWEKLAQRVEQGCPGIDIHRVAQGGKRWVEHDQGDPHLQNRWRTRYNLARFEAMAGDLVGAEADARKAWIDSDRNSGVGVLVFQLNATLGRRDACVEVLAQLKRTANPGDKDLTEAIDFFQQALDRNEIHAPR